MPLLWLAVVGAACARAASRASGVLRALPFTHLSDHLLLALPRVCALVLCAQSDLQPMACAVLLAMLSIMPYDQRQGQGLGGQLEEAQLEQEKERILRMANILGFAVVGSQSSGASGARRRGCLDRAGPDGHSPPVHRPRAAARAASLGGRGSRTTCVRRFALGLHAACRTRARTTAPCCRARRCSTRWAPSTCWPWSRPRCAPPACGRGLR